MVKYSGAVAAIAVSASLGSVSGYSSSFVPGRHQSFVTKSSFSPHQQFAQSSSPNRRSSYSPHSFSKSSSSHTRSSTTSTLSMLIEPCGKDALTAIASAKAPTSPESIIRKTPTVIRKVISKATIPAGAIAGFMLTPSRRIIANAIGGSILGVVSSVGKSKFDAIAAEAALPAIAQLLLDSEFLDNSSSVDRTDELYDEIVSLAGEYKVDVENGDLNTICSHIYTQYILAMCKNPFAKTPELNELSTLRSILKLPSLDIGEAHAVAASEFFRTTCLFTPEEELEDADHPDRMRLDKLLWLSERAFRSTDDSDEAFKFEMSRVAKAVKVEYGEVAERIGTVVEPFYKRALSSTRTKLETNAVSVEMLERARASLGIDEFTKRDMHQECYTDELRALLGKTSEDGSEIVTGEVSDDFVFPDGAVERLQKLQSLLEIPDEDAQYELASEVTPLFQSTVTSVFDRATTTTTTTDDDIDASSLWQEIVTRQAGLSLSDEAMTPLLESAVVQKLGAPLEAAMNFAKVSNEGGVYDALMEALTVKNAIFSVLAHSNNLLSDDLDDKFFSPDSKTSACGFVPAEDRSKLYTFFLARDMKNNASNSSDDTTTTNLPEQVATLLALSENDISNAARTVCGPLVEKELKSAAFEVTGDDWTPVLVDNLKLRIDELILTLKVPDALVKEYSKNTYKDSLRVVVLKCPNGIPTTDMKAQLESLRTLLSLDVSDVYPMHYAAFGAVYKKSVLEAMGSTGIILPDYRTPLEQLVGRLDMAESDAKKIYLSAVEDKLKPMVQLLANELERSILTQQQLAQKSGKDLGQDVFKDGSGPKGTLGIGTDSNIMNNIMNVIDFYKENDIAEKKEDDTTTYPITAIGVGAVDNDMADSLYRQFVVGAFQAQGSDAARYEAESAFFGGILGMSEERMAHVGGNIGSMVYENYIKNALSTKPALDQQDMMFLANIQGKLNLDAEQGTEMMISAQKKVMFDEANAVFANPTVSSSKALREKCNSMGLDMYEDVGLPKDRLESMFAMEVAVGIDSDMITPESADVFTELQESLGLSPEDCEKVLEGMVERKTTDSIHKIEKLLLRGRDENCVPEIQNLLRFAAFVGGDLDSIEIAEDTANKIVNIYNSMDFGETDKDTVSKNKSLLQIAVGLSK